MKSLVSAVAVALLGALGATTPARAQDALLSVDTRLNRVVTLNPFDGSILNPGLITDANDPATFDFQTPRAAIQVGNQIWVSDQSPNVNAIHRFDLAGAFLGSVGGNVAGGGLSNVRGLRYINGAVYAVNAGTTNGAPGAALVRLDPLTGAILGAFSTVAGGVGGSPWDVMWYGGRFLVSDGDSRALQLYDADGTYFGALTGALNNIPQQMFLRANGNVLLAANGSVPLNSYGLYEIAPDGSTVAQWTGGPGLGTRGVYELGNGRYLIAESGGASATRGLGTIDPLGPRTNANFQLIAGLYNGGWISPLVLPTTVIPEPATVVLVGAGVAVLAAARGRRRGRG